MGIRVRLRYADLRTQRGQVSVRERREMLESHRDKVAADIRQLSETLELLDGKVELYRKMEAGEIEDPVAGLHLP